MISQGRRFKIAVLPGDGVGPEIIREALKVFKAIGQKYHHKFVFGEGLIGGAAIDETGFPLPLETLKLCEESEAILLGAVGGPKWESLDSEAPQPEQALLSLRKDFELFTNLRPVKVFTALTGSSTLNREVIEGVDLIVVRELTSGIYFGDKGREEDRAYDTCCYQKFEIERILKAAFDLARKRRKKVTSVDKANILATSRLWREVAKEVAKAYPDVELKHQLVDNCAMQLIRFPKQFDILVTENMFGDILSDEAAMLTGSLGMLPSASLGTGNIFLYEPVHGSCPKYAGKDVANPIATILSGALMLRYSFNLEKEARAIELAVEAVLEEGFRTQDIEEKGCTLVGTEKMGELIANKI